MATHQAGIRVIACLFLLAAAPLKVQAQSADDLAAQVAKRNKKALDEYGKLNFEEARQLLEAALDFCRANGLEMHPATARTYIHLGVLFVTIKQRERGIGSFRKALAIQPDIKLTKSLASPKIQKAFDEASANMPKNEPLDK